MTVWRCSADISFTGEEVHSFLTNPKHCGYRGNNGICHLDEYCGQPCDAKEYCLVPADTELPKFKVDYTYGGNYRSSDYNDGQECQCEDNQQALTDWWAKVKGEQI